MNSPPTIRSDDRQGPGFPATPKGYALSGKIMLIAIIVLFVVVVVMILLHIYARWYLLRGRRRHSHHIRRRNGRRTHLVFYVDSSNPASIFSFPQQGLDPLILKSLPTFTFSPTSKSTSGEEENVVECAVCLSEFEDGEIVRRLPKCDHCFHLDCIDMWFHSHSTCPLCRAPVDADFMSPAKIDDNQQLDIVVDLTESVNHELHPRSCLDTDLRPGSSNSSSFGGRRKGIDLVGVSVDVPARSASFSFTNSDELTSSPGFKSPTSRLLSLKRMLTWEKKPVQSPGSSSCSGIGTSGSELVELEEGRVETRPQTPR